MDVQVYFSFHGLHLLTYFGMSQNYYSVLQNFAAKHPIGTNMLKQCRIMSVLFSYLECTKVDTTLLLAGHSL